MLKPINFSKKDLLSKVEMYLQEEELMKILKLWHLLGKFIIYSFIQLFHQFRFNAVHIPQQDDTLNSTSRRYGTRTEPQTHPNNHSHYPPNETTFRNSFVNPKSHPNSVYRSRDPQREFSSERTIKIHEHVQDKTNINGER